MTSLDLEICQIFYTSQKISLDASDALGGRIISWRKDSFNLDILS
jgi:hypothetical protein